MTCSHCGQEMADGAKFCTHCGTPNPATLFLPASWGKRLGNHILDRIFMAIIAGACFLAAGFYENNNTAFLSFIILGAVLYLAYYLIMEAVWGTTLGKMITGTKVVNKEGNKPRFLQTLGRTAARYIPLEPLSFIFKKTPTGWHDLLSGTYVVNKNMTPEQVRVIDPNVIKAQKSSTVVVVIIILLFVIVIIGILSTVVLASLTTARAKGNQAKLYAEVSSLRAQAEIYAVKNNESYVGFCEGVEVTAMQQYVPNGLTYSCNDSEKAWAFSLPIPSLKGHACVDNTLNPVRLIDAGIGAALECPAPEWKVMEAKNKAFTVEVPGVMEVKTDPGEVDETISFQQDYYKLYAEDGFYAIIQHTYSRAFTAEERSGFIENYLADFATQTKTEIEGYKVGVEEGKLVAEFIAPVPASGEIIKGKMFVGKDSSYLVLLGAEKEGFNEDSYKRFVGSFKVTRE